MLKRSRHMTCAVFSCLLLSFLWLFPGTTAAEKTPPFFDDNATPGAETADRPQADNKKPDLYGKLAEQGFATQEYVVKEGDWLTKILRKKGVLENYNSEELLKILRQLNESLKNINVIRPGEKIVILVKVMPKKEETAVADEVDEYQTYTVKPGDSLHQLAMKRYPLTEKAFFRKYLPLVKKYNPDIANLNVIHPGQKIRLPVYPAPAGVVRTARASQPPSQPIERDVDPKRRVVLSEPKVVPHAFNEPPPPPPKAPEPVKPPEPPKQAKAPKQPKPPKQPEPPKPPMPPEPARKPANDVVTDVAPSGHGMILVLAENMGNIFKAMGEEWTDEGEHFIPMRSGGQINLKTENYPILRLKQGTTVIVDLSGTLPKKMVRLIESTWPTYRVVSIDPQDDLRTALGKILQACHYARVFKRGEPLELGGSIRVKVTGDWIVAPPKSPSGKGPNFIVISLTGPKTPPLPKSIRDYLSLMGIDVLEFPPVPARDDGGRPVADAKKATDAASLVEDVLQMMGRVYNTQRKLTAFSSRKDDFELTVDADFYFQNQGRKAVIDLNGMDPKVISLLKDRGVEVLSLSEEDTLDATLGKLLKFLHIKCEKGPHTFTALPATAATNVRLSVPGVVFKNPGGGAVIAIHSSLSSPILRFLADKGYQVLVLSKSPPEGGQHA